MNKSNVHFFNAASVRALATAEGANSKSVTFKQFFRQMHAIAPFAFGDQQDRLPFMKIRVILQSEWDWFVFEEITLLGQAFFPSDIFPISEAEVSSELKHQLNGVTTWK